MTELEKGSTELSDDAAAIHAANLLRHYGFELGEYSVTHLLTYWLERYPVNWVRLAIVEALYQGRYKAISVEQILTFWQRRGQPSYHFNYEFEHLVCNKFPRSLVPGQTVESSGLKGGQGSGLEVETALNPISQQLARLKSQLTSQPVVNNSQDKNGHTDHPPRPVVMEPPISPVIATSPAATTMIERDESVSSPGASNIAPVQQAPAPETTSTETTAKALSSKPTLLSAGDRGWNSDASSNNGNGVAGSDSPDVISAESGNPPQDNELPLAANLVLPCAGFSDSSLKPKIRLQLTTLYQPNWLISSASKQPIDQFTPVLEGSDFHTKLKAVANPSETDSPDADAAS